MRPLVFIAFASFLVACADPAPPVDNAPVLDPEPAGAPVATVTDALTNLGCLGSNAVPAFSGTQMQLLSWIRTYADPDNAMLAQPAAQVDLFDTVGTPLATGFSDTATGRMAVSVAVRDSFDGYALVTATGYADWYFYSSRPYAPPANPPSAYTWIATDAELDTVAAAAGVVRDPAQGIVVGALHDCNVFGVEHAVIRWGGSTDGVLYFNDPAYKYSTAGIGAGHFALTAGATFTQASGRFAIANVPPGALTVEAFGRIRDSGPLVLLSRADINVTAGAVTSINLEPRVGVDR